MAKTMDLTELLERERVAILSGAFGDLAVLAKDKERLLSDLPNQELGARQLRFISAAVSRNQTLLAAAIEGVRSVTDRLEELRVSRKGFNAYDPKGARSHVGAAQSAFERKA